MINANTVLTCAHVVCDVRKNGFICINRQRIDIYEAKKHDTIDIGIIKLSQHVDLGFQMIFGNVQILDEIITMGYPSVPLTKDAYLISQKGEINSYVNNYIDYKDYFLFSSITRPGNSGGPIFNNRGYIVGIVARHLEDESYKEKNIVPFYQGIPSVIILEALRELEPDIELIFENYD